MIHIFKIAVLIGIMTAGHPIFAQVNAGFENGDFTNWMINCGNQQYTDPAQMDANSCGVLNAKVVGKTTDFYGGFSTVVSGNKALKLGDGSFRHSQTAGYTFKVTNNNKIVKFSYAAVFQDYNHPPEGQPFFKYWVTFDKHKTPNGLNPFELALYYKTMKRIAAKKSDPFFKLSPKEQPGDTFHTPIIYRDWTCVEIDLSLYVGQTVTIWFETSDCQPGPDFGYAYIDGLFESGNLNVAAEVPEIACVNSTSPIYLDGSKSTRQKSFSVELQEYNQAGALVLGSSVKQIFENQPIDKFDLRSWYINIQKKQFKCNTSYRVTLGVSNDCESWIYTSKDIFMDCADKPDAGSDRSICCNFVKSIPIGIPAAGQTTAGSYSWSSLPTGFSDNSPSALVLPNTSTTYTLTYTDPRGCIATDEVDVFVNGRLAATAVYTLNLSCPGDCSKDKMANPSSCLPTLTADATFYKCDGSLESSLWSNKKTARLTYLWSTGETTRTIHARVGVMNYSVTISDGCTSNTSAIITLPYPADYYQKPFPSLNTTTAMNPDVQAKWWKVVDANTYGDAPDYGVAPAYHAYRYRLMIFSRWDSQFPLGGNLRYLVRCQANCNTDGSGLKNGEIQWDGKNDQGNKVQDGQYVFVLGLWNCTVGEYGQELLNYNIPILKQDCEKYGFVATRFLGEFLATGKLETKSCLRYYPPSVDHIENSNFRIGTIIVQR